LSAPTLLGSTYHITDIRALDEKRTGECLLLIDHASVPALGAANGAQLVLQVAQPLHVLKVHAHVGRQDGADHEIAHLKVAKGGGPVPSENLRVRRAVEGFQNGAVVVQLSQWRIQCHQEAVVDTRMTDVMADGRDEEREGFKGPQKGRDGGFGRRRRRRGAAGRIGGQRPDAHQKVESGLQDIDDVAEIVVRHETVVGGAAGDEEAMQLV
jgi:hypothetical protein